MIGNPHDRRLSKKSPQDEMAELTSQERLQPSLLDRLTDDEPANSSESRNQRVMSFDRLRQCVLRDLGWLFNTGNLTQLEDLSEFPMVSQSVVNYGISDMSGVKVSNVNLAQIERRMRQAIQTYEPRIMPDTLKVRSTLDDESSSNNSLTFEIEGELWGEPLPLQLYLRTEVDLETGMCLVTEDTD